MADQPEKPAESAPPKTDNDAPGEKPETLDPDSVLVVDEIDTAELEILVTEAHPPTRTPRIKELLESPDPPSRFMTYLSFAFALLALACTGVLVLKYWEARKLRQAVVVEPPKMENEKTITESLGEFRLILKGADSPNDGELRVDMVAECTNQETCDYLKDHQVQARDIVIPVLVNLRREEVLNPDTKNQIRRRIAEQLNSLPMKGKVIQILFTDLTIEDASDS